MTTEDGNRGPPGKWLLKRRERERFKCHTDVSHDRPKMTIMTPLQQTFLQKFLPTMMNGDGNGQKQLTLGKLMIN